MCPTSRDSIQLIIQPFRHGTFFERSHLSIYQILKFSYVWLENVPMRYIVKEVGISPKTAVDWASFHREVTIFATNEQEPLGGPNMIVEIDESQFGRRKYNVGHRVNYQWVFGGVERGTSRYNRRRRCRLACQNVDKPLCDVPASH